MRFTGEQPVDVCIGVTCRQFESMLKATFCVYDKPDSVGGPVTWITRLLPVLRENGIEARCLFLLHWGDTGPALSSLRDQGFDCRWTVAHHRTQDRVRWILEQLSENPPDVFIPNVVVAGYYASRRVRAAGIPTVGVIHSDDDYYRALQTHFVFGRTDYRLSSVVCVSRQLEQEVTNRNPVATLVRRIPCGVPIPAAPDRNHSGLRLAFAGRLAEEQKCISGLTRAFLRAAREIPGTEATIYGDGPDKKVVDEILDLEGGGLPVSLAGPVSPEEMLNRFLATDVIVLLSDYEGLPIALMEAMACGCVPVCLRIRSGIPELLEDGVTGLLVNDRGDDFVRAIQRLALDPGLRGRLSRAARERIAAEFSSDACGASWAQLLEEVGGAPHPRRQIRLPKSVRLPPLDPALESPEQRAGVPSLPLRLFRRGRIFGGRLKKIVMRRHIE